MKELSKVNENIYRLVIPYKDIRTTVYFIKTSEGVMIFDTASASEDTDNYIVPALEIIGVSFCEVKYIFISHKHRDHAGGLGRLVEKIHNVRILSRSDVLKDEYGEKVCSPEDGDTVMGCLKAVTIPGHTSDSCAILDTRTKTLITGDCLQVYGIFGSGDWGCNITYIREHIAAVEKVKNMDIEEIYTAHDYHPAGYCFKGKKEIEKALKGCIDPLLEIKNIIEKNPSLDDGAVREAYNGAAEVPTVSVSVVKAVRSGVEEGWI